MIEGKMQNHYTDPGRFNVIGHFLEHGLRSLLNENYLLANSQQQIIGPLTMSFPPVLQLWLSSRTERQRSDIGARHKAFYLIQPNQRGSKTFFKKRRQCTGGK